MTSPASTKNRLILRVILASFLATSVSCSGRTMFGGAAPKPKTSSEAPQNNVQKPPIDAPATADTNNAASTAPSPTVAPAVVVSSSPAAVATTAPIVPVIPVTVTPTTPTTSTNNANTNTSTNNNDDDNTPPPPSVNVTVPTDIVVGENGSLLIPITPFANMASGYQATNPGFRAILSANGKVIAAGNMTMDAVINGYSDDSSQGSAYGRLVLNVGLNYVSPDVKAASRSAQKGTLSVCMNQGASMETSQCKSLSGNIHPERPFQIIETPVDYSIEAGSEGSRPTIKVTRFHEPKGEDASAGQHPLVAYHAAFAFAAPGRAFKDFQSPLVLDLNKNGRYDLIDVWNDNYKIYFDLQARDQKVRTGWVAQGDAFLALDLNDNKKIDSGSELFGEYSFTKSKSTNENGSTFENGFLALAQYDDNKDGVIDAKDAIFKKLVVWNDRNSNGISEMNEMKSLSASGVHSLGLSSVGSASAERPLAVLDNEVRLQGTYMTTNGKSYGMGDIWFKQRRLSDAFAASK